MSVGHTHHHHHHHDGHAHRAPQRRALLWCIGITSVMMIVEFVAGYLTRSLLLTSDAIHMLSHTSALAVALIAMILAGRPASEQYTFGMGRFELLGAVVNGVGLFLFAAWIVWESIERLLHPVDVMSLEMVAVAAVGLAVNLLTAWILFRAGAEDLNTKGALLHMLADTIGSVAAVGGGLLIYYYHWLWADPLLSLLVCLLIFRWGWQLLRAASSILMERSPIPIPELRRVIHGASRDIQRVEHLHVLEYMPGELFVTAKVHIQTWQPESCALPHEISHALHEQFGIHKTVIEVHSPDCATRAPANAE